MKQALASAAALVALCTALSHAAGPPAEVTGHVNELTFAVIGADMKGNTTEIWSNWAIALLKDAGAPKDMIDAMEAEMAKPENARALNEELTKAGVKQVYVVVALGTGKEPVDYLLIFPDVTDPAAVSAILDREMTVKIVGETVLASANNTEMLGAFTPAARPDLMAPLANLPSGGTIASVIVPEDARKMLSMALPKLPPMLGGGPSIVLADGVREMVVTVAPPPAFHATIAIKSKDAASADALLALYDTAAKALPPDVLTVVEPIIPDLRPASDGGVLTIDLDQPKAKHMAKVLVPALVKARDASVLMKSQANLRQLGMASMMYANDNKGAVPPSLDVLGEYVGSDDILKMTLKNPRREITGPNYIYVLPPEKTIGAIHSATTRLAAYEAGPFDNGVVVLFWDMHVEFIKDETAFKKLLAEAEKPKAE